MGKDVSPLFREITFGLEDSLVSTLGAVTGIAAGTGSSLTVLLAGIVYVVIESLSLAAGAFISSKTQTEVQKQELEQEKQEIEQHPAEEIKEFEEFIKEKNLEPTDRKQLIRIISKNPQLLLEEVATHQLGISPISSEKPALNALVMSVSYLVGGVFPIIPYALFPIGLAPYFSIALTFLAVIGLGVMKAKVGRTSITKSVLEVLLISVVVTIIGYLVGELIGSLFNLNHSTVR